MHSVSQRQEGPMLDYPHPRRNNTTALDTQGLDTNHTSHIRVNSLSSKGSSSDYSLLRTPQDSNQSDNDALIKQDVESPNGGGWKPSIGIVQEQFTSSPVEEGFPSLHARGVVGKPMPGAMHINTSFTQRSRPAAYSAHPNQKPIASQLPAPQSATAAFPPMLIPSPPLPRQSIPAPNRPAEVKLPDVPRPNPNQSQHRRTKSAPLLSLSPVLNSTPEVSNPLTPPAVNNNHSNNNNANIGNTIRSHENSLNLHNAVNPAAYPQINQMTPGNGLSFANPADTRPFMGAPAAAGFSTFPTMNGFAGMPGMAPQTVSPLMWPPAFFPQTAPASFYPRPQVASPANNMYSPAPTTTWKINPNSQPQMPLSHLINQANGLILGGPSAHNRKIGLYKTEICRNWEEKQSCRYGPKCQFAHGGEDIRVVPRHPKYKTEICRTFWVTGSCPYGKRCCFIHPTATSQQSAPAPISTEQTDRETQHTISLLARLDIKRNSPDGNARHTPDTEASERSGFVYPGMNGHGNGIEAAERSASTARV